MTRNTLSESVNVPIVFSCPNTKLQNLFRDLRQSLNHEPLKTNKQTKSSYELPMYNGTECPFTCQEPKEQKKRKEKNRQNQARRPAGKPRSCSNMSSISDL